VSDASTGTETVRAQAPLRVGLIGFGNAGSTFHAPLISTTADLALTAVVTSDPERQAQVQHRYPGAAVMDTADLLWAAADELDLVVVATPNRTHAPLARAAVEAGLATVVDKPVAVGADEAEELIALAEARGVLLSVFQNRRWDSNFLTVRRLVESGQLGQVWRYESRHERWRPALKGGWRELGDPGEAGGLLFDIGSHLVDQALQLLGPVDRVYAEMDVRRAGAQVDDDSFVALHHVSGARSQLSMTVLTAAPAPLVRVLGEKGSFLKYGMDGQEDALKAGLTPASPGWGVDPVDLRGRVDTGAESAVVESEPGAYQVFYARMAEALRGRGPVPVDPKDALMALWVLEAARRSAQEQRVVTL
jgi:predicted dehydrogenase